MRASLFFSFSLRGEGSRGITMVRPVHRQQLLDVGGRFEVRPIGTIKGGLTGVT